MMFVGWHVAKVGDRWAALDPVRQGVRHAFGFRQRRGARTAVRCDWGSQYIADAWINEVKWLGISISPTYVGEPQCKGVMERFNRTLKEQCIYLHRFKNVEAARTIIGELIARYNTEWRIERLGHQTPAQARARVSGGRRDDDAHEPRRRADGGHQVYRTRFPGTVSRATLVFALPAILAGCGLTQFTYLSPSVAVDGAEYLHMYVAPEQHGKTYPPTGVKFGRSGARFVIISSRSGIHGGISRVERPDPVCAREAAAVVLPPVPWKFKQQWGTEAFEVRIAVDGDGVSFDPTQVTLIAANGTTEKPSSVTHDRDRSSVLRFSSPCVPDAAYDLVIDGVTSGGVPVVVPPIHFAPVTTSSPFGP